MVNSVSAVQIQPQVQNMPQEKIGAMDKITQEQLAHPGYYVVSPIKGLYEVPEPEYKKKGGFFKFLGKLLLTAVVVGGVSIGIRKSVFKNYNPKEVADKGEKFKNWFVKWTDKLYDGITGIFKKTGEKVKTDDAKQSETSS